MVAHLQLGLRFLVAIVFMLNVSNNGNTRRDSIVAASIRAERKSNARSVMP
jgi:hypothetical protein